MKKNIVNIKQIILLTIINLFFYNRLWAERKKGITIVPVADLVGHPLSKNKKNTLNTWYTNLPYSHKKKAKTCERMHQLLFNEEVEILEEKENQVKISIPNIFYELKNGKKQYTEYWTLKRNIASVDELKKDKIPLSIIPTPVSFNNKDSLKPKNTVTLLAPYTDQHANIQYSAGTRFIYTKKTTDFITVSAIRKSSKKYSIKTLQIPTKLCFMHQSQDKKKKIKQFIKILQSWSQDNRGYIPYVLGGCSYTQRCTKNLSTKNDSQNNTYYYRSKKNSRKPCTGLDCTGLIARAAQIAGIPYFYKNTTTVAKYLAPLKNKQNLNAGDIIWFPGHVLIISDIKNNTVIEARSYDHGYGKIHELPIKKIFKEITTINDLKQAFFEQKPLKRLNIKGNSVSTIQHFNLLKLSSVWNI